MEINHDSTTYERVDDFAPIPAGTYSVIILKAEERPVKNDKGSMLNLTYQIKSHEQEGRMVWDNLLLNYNDPSDLAKSQKTVTIARNKLQDICDACGVQTIRTENDLLDRVMMVEIAVVSAEKSYNGKPGNEIKKYLPKGTQKPTREVSQDDPLANL